MGKRVNKIDKYSAKCRYQQTSDGSNLSQFTYAYTYTYVNSK